MDSGTATHPPCPMCDPSLLPEDYSPLPNEHAMVRPDGSVTQLRGSVKVYVDGIDVTNSAKEADPEHGVVVAYHRVMGEGRKGKREMVRHFYPDGRPDWYEPGRIYEPHACQMVLTGEVVVIDVATGEAPVLREPDVLGECANCGEAGHPGHHWMVEVGYVCEHKPDMVEDAPPPPGVAAA